MNSPWPVSFSRWNEMPGSRASASATLGSGKRPTSSAERISVIDSAASFSARELTIELRVPVTTITLIGACAASWEASAGGPDCWSASACCWSCATVTADDIRPAATMAARWFFFIIIVFPEFVVIVKVGVAVCLLPAKTSLGDAACQLDRAPAATQAVPTDGLEPPRILSSSL
jgi:hypothetical protein